MEAVIFVRKNNRIYRIVGNPNTSLGHTLYRKFNKDLRKYQVVYNTRYVPYGHLIGWLETSTTNPMDLIRAKVKPFITTTEEDYIDVYAF